MKFAREFNSALIKEGFPPHWVESAVMYCQLKKCIKNVESELGNLGFDLATLARLNQSPDQEEQTTWQSSDVAFQYDLNGDNKYFHPKLTLFIQLRDGLTVDATLSPDTRKYLENLASKQQGTSIASVSSAQYSSVERMESCQVSTQVIKLASSVQKALPTDRPVIQQVEVPLTFDVEFFELLQGDVTNLNMLQAGEQKRMTDEIVALSTDITNLARPSKFSKTDLYRWRELFDIYLQAGIFFSTHELDHGSRDSTIALRQLEWFQSEVTKRGLVDSFKLPASRQALNRFININMMLLWNLKFQEINQKAITKILKKFDKKTKLGATRTFPKLMQSESIMSETMAKAVCSQITQDLVKVVPQLDDYLCPICFTISWRPVRMKCQHIFCIRCAVLMQRERKQLCPLCRGKVIMEADEDNIDSELAAFLKKYFPKETKEKQIALETAAGIEQFGIFYKHPSESKCLLM